MPKIVSTTMLLSFLVVPMFSTSGYAVDPVSETPSADMVSASTSPDGTVKEPTAAPASTESAADTTGTTSGVDAPYEAAGDVPSTDGSTANEKETTTAHVGKVDAPVLPYAVTGGKEVSLEDVTREPVPFPVRVVDDSKLPAGVEVVVKEGSEGVLSSWTGMVDGVKVTQQEVTEAPQEKVVRRGTNKEIVLAVSEKVVALEKQKDEAAKKAEADAAAAAHNTTGKSSQGGKTRTPSSASANGTKNTPSAPSSTSPLTGNKYDWMRAAGIKESDFAAADFIVSRESGWNPQARNRSSGAFGLPQALPGTKMASAGSDWQTNPVTQLKWMKSYVEGRYGSFAGAVAHSKAKGWY